MHVHGLCCAVMLSADEVSEAFAAINGDDVVMAPVQEAATAAPTMATPTAADPFAGMTADKLQAVAAAVRAEQERRAAKAEKGLAFARGSAWVSTGGDESSNSNVRLNVNAGIGRGDRPMEECVMCGIFSDSDRPYCSIACL